MTKMEKNRERKKDEERNDNETEPYISLCYISNN